jgi:hypothetical protein
MEISDMETSIIAVIIGLAIAGVSYYYGRTNGIRIGIQKGLFIGTYLGTSSLISIFSKNKLIKLSSDGRQVVYVGNEDNSLNSSQLIEMSHQYGVDIKSYMETTK